MKVFVDANILFSAADESSNTRILFDLAAAKSKLVTSAHAIEEARRNLALKRTKHLEGLAPLLDRIRITTAFRHDLKTELPLQDQPIIAAASADGCTHLWTSDKKHFGDWYGRKLADVSVVSSSMLYELLGKTNS